MAGELLLPGAVLSLSVGAAEALLSAADGDAALLYLCLLTQGGRYAPEGARRALKWDIARLDAAFATLVKLALASPTAEVAPAPTAPSELLPEYTAGDINRELEDKTSPFPGLVTEVQRRLGKILSTADLKVLYTLYDHQALPAEVICLLVSFSVEEMERKYGPGRKPRMPQIQKEGFVWRRLGVDTSEAAEAYLQQQATQRSREGEVLKLLGLKPNALVEKVRRRIATWADMGFPNESIHLAYEKTVYKKQTLDWDYMNGILNGWHKKNLHTVGEIEAGDSQRNGTTRTATTATTGEADARVREDLERMRAFMKKQRDAEGG